MRASATEFKNHFGEYMQKVYQEPIIVEKSGKPSAVLVPYDAFESIVTLEDLYWGMRAEAARKKGFLGPKETERRWRERAKKEGFDLDGEA